MKTELEMVTEQNENISPELRLLTKGMTIAEHKILRCNRLSERVVGDSYATWITLCEATDPTSYHKWVTWIVVARPEGFRAESGHYFTDGEYEKAFGNYESRGGW